MKPTGAGHIRMRFGSRWLLQHRTSITDTVAQLRSNTGSVVLSVLVIGVTLALPLGLNVLQENFYSVVSQLGSRSQATLFLVPSATRAEAEALARSLGHDQRLGQITVVYNDQALAEFAQSSGLGDVITTLAENPLPHALVIEIKPSRFEGEFGRRLQQDLERTPGVAQTEFDITWIRRLQTISDLARRATIVFSAVLAMGVILITGNTIRGGIHHRREEIEVVKLCGATDAFVRRPFLYNGALQGLAGALVACAVVAIAIGLLGAPAHKLALAYGSDIQLTNISTISALSVLAFGSGLGWAGAWIAVTVFLRQIDITRAA